MRVYRIARLISIGVLPGLPIVALFACNTINPMSRAFMTEFTVTNNSSSLLRITPVGTVGVSNHKTHLHLLTDSSLYWHSFRTSRFEIQPGRTLKFVYDWDDIQFSDILVESNGQSRALIVDVEPTKNQYRPPDRDHFEIRHLEHLPQAKPEIAELGRQTVPWLDLYLLGSLFALPTFLTCRRKLRALTRAAG